ncbi:MAG: hypothetical protein HGA19_04110 [Oscillochloris sp.]|nr:hypothetical protein [Oscillochloris sp.]
MLLALAVITALVGGIGLMGALSIAVVERTREISVLRAIGATTPALRRMLILEGVNQGFLAGSPPYRAHVYWGVERPPLWARRSLRSIWIISTIDGLC